MKNRLFQLAVFAVGIGAPLGAAHATWSVTAADQQTKRVVIATATCVPQSTFAHASFKTLMDIQGIIIPGVGAAAAQANSDPTNKNQALIVREMTKGTHPSEILAMLMTDPNVQVRQFGFVDLQGRFAGFSGAKNERSANAVGGQVPGQPIYYSIQGNTLRSSAVVQNAVRAFESAKGTVTDRVMAALEAGNAAGGDSRCSCESQPLPKGHCVQRHAMMAYLMAADPTDTAGTDHADGHSYTDGKLATLIYVNDENTQANESPDPVATLRMRYNAWKKTH